MSRKSSRDALSIAVAGRARANSNARSIREMSGHRAGCFSQQPLGKRPGRFDECRIVEQRQRLLRRVAHDPDGRAFLARRGVEIRQHRMQERPLPVHVDATAILPIIDIGDVVAVRELQRVVVIVRLIRFDARSAHVADSGCRQSPGRCRGRTRRRAAAGFERPAADCSDQGSATRVAVRADWR